MGMYLEKLKYIGFTLATRVVLNGVFWRNQGRTFSNFEPLKNSYIPLKLPSHKKLHFLR